VKKKLVSPAAERNKEPILEVLRRVLPSTCRVLEIAGGSGQHAAFFAENLPGIDWLTTDIEAERLASMRVWCRESKLANLLAPRRLDVLDDDWGLGFFGAVFNANFIHITPWKCCLGLLAGARRHLHPGGLLIFYGPFRIGGELTAPSNADFDEDLRGRNAEWGVRDLEAVEDAAIGFRLEERVEMPANNQMLVFRRT